LKDFKNYSLHEHLFDGDDDIWLSRLDEIFDDSFLDSELFGRETSSHLLMMSFLGGIIAVPFFLTINFYTTSRSENTHQILSLLGILEAY
jgi:hypothetical protein